MKQIIFFSLLILSAVFQVFSEVKDNQPGLKNIIEIQTVFRNIAKDIIPKVVRLDVTTLSADKKTTNKSLGSGIIIEQEKDEIFIITNNHVVNGATEINIILNNDKQYAGELVGSDERSDVGVIKFKSKEIFQTAKLGSSADIQIGDWAIAVGNPFGFNGSLTVGVISALGRAMYGRADATSFIQTDAAVNPGNSGGPLLNIKGEVIGVNSWIASQTGSNTGLSFSIPIDTAMSIYQKLKKNKSIDYAWFGVAVKSLTDSTLRKSLEITREHGAFVAEVISDSPAEKAGIKVGDIIIAIDNNDVKDANELIWLISKYNPGDTVTITYISDDKVKKISIVLTKRPSKKELTMGPATSKDIGFLGANFSNVDKTVAERSKLKSVKGVWITKIASKSSAKEYGLQVGDVVTKINKTEINTTDDLEDFMTKAGQKNLDAFYLTVIRNGKEMIIGVSK